MTFQTDQTVYLPDGRKAIYVLANRQDHLVRLIVEVDGIYDEPPYSYPSDKITTTREVYAQPPVEVWDKQVLAKREQVRELDRELMAKRQEIADATKNKVAMEKAAAKYPCIQQALDFIEGRITHVVAWDGYSYGAAKIHTMPEAFEQVDSWRGRKKHEGMRLLSLFGTDERGRSVGWGLHKYSDGSGGGTAQIWPAKSEDEAREFVRGLLGEAFDAWRTGDEKWWHDRISVAATLKANPWFTPPEDWVADQTRKAEEQRNSKIAKLREEITKLEDEA